MKTVSITYSVIYSRIEEPRLSSISCPHSLVLYLNRSAVSVYALILFADLMELNAKCVSVFLCVYIYL